MRVATVARAIREASTRISEWEEVEQSAWREDHTKYGIIDPIIRSLGWNTAEPRECHPEYPRGENGDRVDYALFARLDMAKLQEGDMPPPCIIVEAKKLGAHLDEYLDKLREYTKAYPRTTGGVAVLTNGVEWRLYQVGSRGGLRRNLGDVDTVNIKSQFQQAALRRAVVLGAAVGVDTAFKLRNGMNKSSSERYGDRPKVRSP